MVLAINCAEIEFCPMTMKSPSFTLFFNGVYTVYFGSILIAIISRFIFFSVIVIPADKLMKLT